MTARTYEDFNRFIEKQPGKHVEKMDVMEGKKGVERC